MHLITRLGVAVLIAALIPACSQDDDPIGPPAVGSSSNPERIEVGTPKSGSLDREQTWFTVFRTGAAGDYEIALTGDQPLAWELYAETAPRAAGALATDETCGGQDSGGNAVCIASALAPGTDYILELANLGLSSAQYMLNISHVPE